MFNLFSLNRKISLSNSKNNHLQNTLENDDEQESKQAPKITIQVSKEPTEKSPEKKVQATTSSAPAIDFSDDFNETNNPPMIDLTIEGPYECLACYEPIEKKHESLCKLCPQKTVCTNCMIPHITSNIENGNLVNIGCPKFGCKGILPVSNIISFLKSTKNDEWAARYEQLVTKAELEMMDGFVWCAHLGCGNGMINDDKEYAPIVTCYNCNGKTCYTHKCVWHEGRTCEEYNDEIEGNQRNIDAYLNEHTKRCPKCQMPFEKDEKCDHVKCFKCHFQFCWECGADHKLIMANDNSFHKPHCSHHSNNIK